MKTKRYRGHIPTLHRDLALIAAAVTIFICAHVAVAAMDKRDAETTEPETIVTEQAPQTEVRDETQEGADGQMSAEEMETILQEDERIEAALIEQGYFREDIPLSFLEQDFLHTACDEFGIDYYVMVALIERETDFRNISGDGGDSAGFCQVQEKWWRDLMEEIGAEDLNDPYDNFRTACAILTQHRAHYGSIEAALTAYNQGAYKGRVTEYAKDILANAEKWRNP